MARLNDTDHRDSARYTIELCISQSRPQSLRVCISCKHLGIVKTKRQSDGVESPGTTNVQNVPWRKLNCAFNDAVKLSFIGAKKLRCGMDRKTFLVESHASKRTGGDGASGRPRDWSRQFVQSQSTHLELYQPTRCHREKLQGESGERFQGCAFDSFFNRHGK